jgi:peptidoglycan/LPS O-acetylase OafA/YrhL
MSASTNAGPATERTGYRADIDGLRAFAVVAVVLFHAFPRWLAGGYVGVDVFFVISGFLITRILLDARARGRLSLTHFYANRVRRLFPALVLVLAAVFVLGWGGLLPHEFAALGLQIAAGAAFLQNVYLFTQAGYFELASDSMPLMHLWSLGVEEQFYLLYPMLLWIAWRRGVPPIWVIGGLFALSFVLNIVTSAERPVAAFFLLHTRMWELMTGCGLAAMGLGGRTSDGARVSLNHELIAAMGLAALSFAVLRYTPDLSYPGWAAVVPVAGAALLIAAGPQTWINRYVLAVRPLVALGLISYPLYLWHWPVLAYIKLLSEDRPTVPWLLAALCVSVLMAWATYAWVEKPIRFGRISPKAPFALLGAAAAAAGLGLFTYTSMGFESRIGPALAAKHFQFQELWTGWSQGCASVTSYGNKIGGCFILSQEAPPNVLVIGDSHAAHLAPGLRVLAGGDVNVATIWHAGCLPIRQARIEETILFGCQDDLIERALDLAANSQTIHTVVLSGFVPLGLTGQRMNAVLPNLRDVASYERAFESALDETFDQLQREGKAIVYVLTVPEPKHDPFKCVRALLWATPYDACQFDRAAMDARHRPYREAVARVAARYPSVTVVDPMEVFCDARYCQLGRPDLPYYLDNDHLTPSGSRYLMANWTRLHGPLFRPGHATANQ